MDDVDDEEEQVNDTLNISPTSTSTTDTFGRRITAGGEALDLGILTFGSVVVCASGKVMSGASLTGTTCIHIVRVEDPPPISRTCTVMWSTPL